MKTGLVLEGGGMRGLYTVGVLDYLMDQELSPDYIIGVSAGACNGASFAAGQKDRGYHVNMDYLEDKRYVGLSNLIRNKSMFGMDFIFDEIPNDLYPFDYDAFQDSPCEFKVGVTDVETGKPVYFDKADLNGDCTVLRASSSIPLFSPMVEYNGRKYLDGGTADPIPVRQALADGCEKLVVVLTQDRHYEKEPQKFRKLYRRVFRKYPRMILVLDARHQVYNDTLKYLRRLEAEDKALIIAPKRPLEISRFEKDQDKLNAVHKMALSDAAEKRADLLRFLRK
jgi:predicted patatin/cPLA2 family phospholipase